MAPIFALDVVGAANAVAALGGFVAIGGLVWLSLRGNPERQAEESARDYFDRHGRWPDE